ncbi:MAG: hypothetical protein U0Z44_08850 [Kouleothrix sp.]
MRAPACGAGIGIHGRALARLALGLVGAVWALGLVGHVTPLTRPALVLYVLGSIGLTLWHCRRYQAWRAIGLTGVNLRSALLWGGLIGAALMLVDLANTFVYYRGGGAPLAEMERILAGHVPRGAVPAAGAGRGVAMARDALSPGCSRAA